MRSDAIHQLTDGKIISKYCDNRLIVWVISQASYDGKCDTSAFSDEHFSLFLIYHEIKI